MTSTHVVFVYGTLRKDQRNRRVMEPRLVRELGSGSIRGQMYDLGAFPAVTLHGNDVVVGEWVEVTDDGLAALDRLEGYPRFYDRTVSGPGLHWAVLERVGAARCCARCGSRCVRLGG